MPKRAARENLGRGPPRERAAACRQQPPVDPRRGQQRGQQADDRGGACREADLGEVRTYPGPVADNSVAAETDRRRDKAPPDGTAPGQPDHGAPGTAWPGMQATPGAVSLTVDLGVDWRSDGACRHCYSRATYP